jgi:hypothetical protein
MPTPSVLIVPNRLKAGILYSQLPANGDVDFSVTRATTAYRTNASGILESVASGVPRLDYPIGGGCPSLLVEPAATNLALRSEEFNDASWIKTETTITANATSSPNATTTADKIIPSVVNSIHQVNQNITAASGNVTFSFFAKKAELSQIAAVITGGGIVGTLISGFDLNTKSFFLGTGSFSNLANDWVRISITTPTDGTALNVRLRIYSAGNATFAGNASDGLFLWGAQLETGSVATSYIPTIAATATRNADVISKTGVSGFIGQTEGTLYAEVDVSKLLGTVVRGMLSISNNTTTNRIQIGFTGASANTIRVIYSGASTINYNFAITTIGIYKIAFAYSATSTAFYVNGSLVSALGGNSFSASVGNVYLGSVFDGTLALNDRIRAAAIYPTRLTNAELASLTTL